MYNIAFCGVIGAGKTEMAEKCKEEFGGEITSIAKPLKDFVQAILDTITDGLLPEWKILKKPHHRKMLIYVANRLREPEFGWPTFWIDKIKPRQEGSYIDDLRYPNEEKSLKEKKFIIVKFVLLTC